MRSYSDVYIETCDNGGGTYDHSLNPINFGFAVGIVNGNYASALTPVTLGDAFQRIEDNFGATVNFGTWIDGAEDNFRIIIDPVVVLECHEDAITIARAFNQDAIYCLHEHREIRIQK